MSRFIDIQGNDDYPASLNDPDVGYSSDTDSKGTTMPEPQMVEAVTYEEPMCGMIPNADLPEGFVWNGQILKPIIELVEHNVGHVIEDWIREGKTMDEIAQNTTAIVAVITARLLAMSMSGNTVVVKVEGMSPAIERNFG